MCEMTVLMNHFTEVVVRFMMCKKVKIILIYFKENENIIGEKTRVTATL